MPDKWKNCSWRLPAGLTRHNGKGRPQSWGKTIPREYRRLNPNNAYPDLDTPTQAAFKHKFRTFLSQGNCGFFVENGFLKKKCNHGRFREKPLENVEQAPSPALFKNSRGRLFYILFFQEKGFYL